jgi:pSer/pThr/pTyr-binding forkhead associated (FHA) protein
VIIECTSCRARYQYDEDRFERKPSKKIKCAKCASVFEIFNPAFAAKEPARNAGDSTFARRSEETRTRPPEKPIVDTTETSPLPDRSTDQKVGALTMPAGKRLSLAVIAGNDGGNVYRIEKPRVTIGRSGADFNITDSEASRQHAAVEVHDTVIILEDLKSTNGTLIDGERITETIELQDKAEFQIGSTILMLIVTDE